MWFCAVAPTSVMAAAGDAIHWHPRLTAPSGVSSTVSTIPATVTVPGSPIDGVGLHPSVCEKITPFHPASISVSSAAGHSRTASVMGRTSLLAPLTATRSSNPFIKPVAGARVSSDFGTRYHPVRRVTHRHNGVDLVAPTGTAVRAAAKGVVKRIGFERRGFGHYVVLAHRYDSETFYAHLSSSAKGLRVGDSVAAGEVIGAVGKSGMATGPHLHFELRRKGNPVDPRPLFGKDTVETAQTGSVPDHKSGTFGGGCQSVLNGVPSWHTHGRIATMRHWQYSPL